MNMGFPLAISRYLSDSQGMAGAEHGGYLGDSQGMDRAEEYPRLSASVVESHAST